MDFSPKDAITAVQRSIETGPEVALRYLHPTRYRQHNPSIADGRAAILDVHARLPRDEAYANVVRAFQDGDFGVVHVAYHLFEPTVAFDIHRYEDGVSVEHWDNLQRTPTGRNPSGRTMTDGKTQVQDRERTDVNKALAERFTREVLLGEEPDRLDAYFHDGRLLQHSPEIGDGADALRAHRAEQERRGTPVRYDRIHMVLGEGSFVLVLSEGEHAGRPTAFYDLYRIADDHIAEHWDVVEEIPAPERRLNDNGKF